MSTIHTTMSLLLMLTHKAPTMGTCTMYPTYTPTNSQYQAPTTKEHTMHTHTHLIKGDAIIVAEPTMRDLYHMEVTPTHTKYTIRTCPTTCTCRGTYTQEDTMSTHTMRPIHRAYMCAMITLTLLCMGAYALYHSTPVYTAWNGWSFITMVMAIPSMCVCAYQYHTHRARYMGKA